MSETMADKMKRKLSAKNATAIILFGAIVLVFVFFGLPGRMGQGVGSVARVNNTLISVADFQQEENRMLEYYQKMFGSQIDFSQQRQMLRQQALENLVHMELVSQVANKSGIVATDAEVRDFIVKDIPFFQQNGQFQRERYFAYLENTRSTPAGFENKVRKDIMNIRTRHLFESALGINEVEEAKIRAMKAKKINIQFAKIDSEAAEKELKKEKAEALFKELDEALAKGDEAAVNAKLKALNAKWEETGLVEFGTEAFPNIQSSIATEAIYELTKAEPLLKKLVRDGSMKFVLKLKETKNESEKVTDKKDALMVQRQRSVGMFESWVNQFRSKSNVSMETSVLKM